MIDEIINIIETNNNDDNVRQDPWTKVYGGKLYKEICTAQSRNQDHSLEAF